MSESPWYLTRDGKTKHGPYTPTQFKDLAEQGHLLAGDMVRRADWPKWRKAAEVEGLFQPATAALPVEIRPPRARVAVASGVDSAGVLGITLGILATGTIALGCCTCGMSWLATLPLALAGGACALGSTHLPTKLGGLVLNGTALLVVVPIFLITHSSTPTDTHVSTKATAGTTGGSQRREQ